MSYDDRWMVGYSLLSNEMPESLSEWPEIDVESVEREGNRCFKPYIFRRQGHEGTELWCSCCMEHVTLIGQTHPATWTFHKDEVVCPCCGTQARLIDTKYIRTGKALRQSWPMVVLTERGGDIYARAYWMKKDYSQLPTYEWSVRPRFYLVGAYRFTAGRAEQWAQHRYWNKFDCEAEEGKINPSHRKVREPFTEGGGRFQRYSSYKVCGIEAIEQSRFRYCQYEDYVDSRAGYHHCLMRYLAAASIYPRQVEMLHKMGFDEILAGMVEGRTKYSDAFNWEATDPKKALGLTKQELRSIESRHKPELIGWYKKLKNAGLRVNFEELERAVRRLPYGREGNRALTMCIKEKMTPGKLLEYLEGNARKYSYGGTEKVSSVWRRLKDYQNTAAKLGWDMSEYSVRFPRDLNARHDEAAAENQLRIDREKCEALAKKEIAAAESLERRRKKYNIEVEGYVLRIAETATEIIEEGRIQRHCVAGYAERHLADKLTIMFLRHADRPNTALYTIEMQGNALIQIHGYRNDWEAEVKPMEAMGWLIEPWLKWLERGSPRDKEGRPKLKINRMQEAG